MSAKQFHRLFPVQLAAKHLFAVVVAAVFATTNASNDLTIRELRQLRDEAVRFNAEAAHLAISDLAKDPNYDSASHLKAVKELDERREWAIKHLSDANDPSSTEAAALVRNYRAALLANPLLAPDRILCIRRQGATASWGPADKPGGSDFPYSKRRLSRKLGLLGLNAHNHMDLDRTGFTNDIAVVSGLRGTPSITTLYRPPGTSIVRDIDLDFDASRILFTSYRGTNNLLGVYEIEIKSPPSAALSTPTALSGPSGLSAASQLSAPSGLSELSREATLRGEAPLNNLKLRGEAPLRAEAPLNNLKLRGEAPLRAEAPLNLRAKLVSPEDGHYDIQWWDGCYLPNKDQVIMLGTAAYQFLPCEDGNFPMCVLYRIDRRTGETIQLTFEQDSDYTPAVLNDGRIAYTRWEYSDIQHYFSRELMTMNPDGVGQLALWGSGSYFPTFFCGARSIPGDPHKVVMMAGGHHGRAEHGRMLVLDPSLARKYPLVYDPPDREWGPPCHTLRIPVKTLPAGETGLIHEFPGRGQPVEGDVSDLQVDNQFARGKPYFSHPWPLGGNYFLASAKCSEEGLFGLYLVDSFDNMILIAEAPGGSLFEPMLFAPRTRPPVIADRRVKGAKTCTVHIADIHSGPGLKGVPRGTVRKLRIFAYHFCYHKTGGHVSMGLDKVEAGWDVKRVLGTVDVEADGSVCFEMPANTPVSFQPLDSEGAAVQLMRSWTVGMPGERVSCTGCHEDNRTSITTSRTLADKRPIQKITPPDADGPRPWGFAAEMYPHLVESCAGCHGGEKTSSRPVKDIGTLKDHKRLQGVFTSCPEAAYRFLHPFIRRGGAESELQMLEPMEFHASTSPLVQMLKKGHHGARLSETGWRQLYAWIDLNCPFYGKWSPAGFKTDRFVLGCNDQVARRKELAAAYANTTDDPEAEYDRHLALVNKRLSAASQRSAPAAPSEPGREATLRGEAPLNNLKLRGEAPLNNLKLRGEAPLRAAGPLDLKGWPMSANDAAALQLGRIDEIAPVTVRTLELGRGASMTFRRIPAGTFVMGSTNGCPDESPRIVRIARPFWISEMEVDNAQYHAFDPAHDSRSQDQWGFDQVMPGHVGNHRRQPVVRVSRDRALAFCAWLSSCCAVRATLPTEEQWEWAARAGTDTPFPWGGLDDDFGRRANLADRTRRFIYSQWDAAACVQTRRPYPPESNYPLHEERWEDDWFTLNFTGRTLANRWGLYDMHGNAAEWTSTTINGLAVVRGGSFASRPKDATSSVKLYYLPWQKVYDVGFRVILEE